MSNSTKRSRLFRKKIQKAGLTRYEVLIKPEWKEAVKQFVKKLSTQL